MGANLFPHAHAREEREEEREFFFPWESKRQRRKILSASSARGRALEKNIWFANPIYAHARWEGGRGLPRGKNI